MWHEQGADLDQRMLALSTYMGHVKISNTYWYLSGVPELMALAGARGSSASPMPGSATMSSPNERKLASPSFGAGAVVLRRAPDPATGVECAHRGGLALPFTHN